MSTSGGLKIVVVIALGLILAHAKAQANSFAFTFFNGTDTVGAGSFSFSEQVGDGSYNLSDLSNLMFDFSVGANVFTNADAATPFSEVLAVVYDNGAKMYFDNDGAFSGPQGGSLDFTQNSAYLTFEPSYYGPPPLDLYAAFDNNQNFFFGPFDASVVTPEPGSAALVGVLAGAVGLFWMRKRRTRA